MSGVRVAKIVVIVAGPLVPTAANKHPLPIADHVVNLNRVRVVSDRLLEGWVIQIVREISVPLCQRQRPISVDHVAGNGIDQIGWDDVVRKRILLIAPASHGAACEGIVDLILRTQRQQFRKVAFPHFLGRNRSVGANVIARSGLMNALVAPHEERLILSVVELGQTPPDHPAWYPSGCNKSPDARCGWHWQSSR